MPSREGCPATQVDNAFTGLNAPPPVSSSDGKSLLISPSTLSAADSACPADIFDLDELNWRSALTFFSK